MRAHAPARMREQAASDNPVASAISLSTSFAATPYPCLAHPRAWDAQMSIAVGRANHLCPTRTASTSFSLLYEGYESPD